MKKLAVIAAAVILTCLTSCDAVKTPDIMLESSSPSLSSREASQDAKPEREYTTQEIEAAIAKAMGDGYYCDKYVTEENIEYTFFTELDLTRLNSYTINEHNNDTYKLDMTAVFDCQEDYAQDVVDMMNNILAADYRYLKTYPFSVTPIAKVENARVFRRGNTVMLIIGGSDLDEGASDEEKTRHALEEYEKIDNAVKDLFGELPENLIDIEGAYKRRYPGEEF